ALVGSEVSVDERAHSATHFICVSLMQYLVQFVVNQHLAPAQVRYVVEVRGPTGNQDVFRQASEEFIQRPFRFCVDVESCVCAATPAEWQKHHGGDHHHTRCSPKRDETATRKLRSDRCSSRRDEKNKQDRDWVHHITLREIEIRR